jgi:hypothetical protein
MNLKPGHYLLFALALYALVVTLGFAVRGRQLHALREEVGLLREKAALVPEGYRLPLLGACLPSRPENLPGAPRPYRKGVSAGFVFVNGDACVPVVRGMGVVAAQAGEVVKVEEAYQEPSLEAWRALMERVKDGASPEDMDLLRGLEVWVRHRRAHLGLRPPSGPLPGAKGGGSGLPGRPPGLSRQHRASGRGPQAPL